MICTNYTEWCQQHPAAAWELEQILTDSVTPLSSSAATSEARAQQDARLSVARQGALSFRNNVGATPSKCKHCGAKQQPVRFGLANDSKKMNDVVKSSDLILGIPRLITPQHVGTTVLQFGGLEIKRPGWPGVTTDHERAQAAWLALLESRGGYGRFATGEIML